MTYSSYSMELSPLDTSRFGIISARAFLNLPEHCSNANDFCVQNNVTFLIARCPVTSLSVAQAMEKSGFLLMDTLCYYAFDTNKTPLPPHKHNHIIIRPLADNEEEYVQRIAGESFVGYSGHYHADPRLINATCDAVYSSWATNSCAARNDSHEVLVAVINQKIVGFITVQTIDGKGETVLSGVSADAQRQGVYHALMGGAVRWCIERGITTILTSTQLSNIAVQKVWVRLGFEPAYAYYTFHKWFD